MEKRKTNHETDKVDAFKKWASKILHIYEKELRETKQYLINHHSQNKHLLSQTSFEVMNRHLLEETHSNVIAYLLRSKSGKMLLSAILKSFPLRKIKKMDIEHLDKFIVIREKQTDTKKRIDIWIESNADAFVIVIENKFNAKLHMVDEDTKQTDLYHQYATNYCNQRKMIPIFILLDYKNSEISKKYHSMDYTDLLNILKKVEIHFQEDLVFKEYILLLKRLQKNIIGYSIDNADNIGNLTALNNLVEVLDNGFTK